MGAGRQDDDLGLRPGGHPPAGRRHQQRDVYGMFFTKAAFDRFKLTKEEFALVKEQEDKAEKEKKEPARRRRAKAEEARGDKPPKRRRQEGRSWSIGPAHRTEGRLTIHTSPAERLGALEGRREALLPDELRQGQRPLGDGIANEGDEALCQARRQTRPAWSCPPTASSSSSWPTASR